MDTSVIRRWFFYSSKLCLSMNHLKYVLRVLPVVMFILCMANPVCSYEITKGAQIGHDLTEMSITELMNIEVSIISKQPERYFNAPAAIFVISSEDIQRSGATSIPELLRMVPGSDVEQINSNQWAVTFRGTAFRLTRTLLVMVDGRSVYSPTFGGVFWEDLDLVLEDIDRIEVVRGPGGTYWGANATTGIVNIITKKAQDTQGGLLTMGAGTPVEKAFGSVRYGGKTGEDLYYRVYAKYSNRDGLYHSNPRMDDYDKWQMGQVGFRADKDLSERDSLSVHGDFYGNDLGLYGPTGVVNAYYVYDPVAQTVTQTSLNDGIITKRDNSFGGNFVARWNRKLDAKSDWTAQLYYDKSVHSDILYNADTDTMDLDFQHRFPWIWRQNIIWGVGYRFTYNKTTGTKAAFFTPANESYHLFSGFIQDDIELVRKRLHFIVGSKFEHNMVSGYEVQPSARLLWTPTSEQTFWTAVSRAVRTPSRFDYQYEQDELGFVHGLEDLGISPNTPYASIRRLDRSEIPQIFMTYELGHRIMFGHNFAIDTVLFYTDVRNSESLEVADASNPLHLVNALGNKINVKLFGGEISFDFKPLPWWRLNAYCSVLHMRVFRDIDSTDTENLDDLERISPRFQSALRSYMDLPFKTKLDWTLRYVADMPYKNVDSYYSFDVRLAWKVKPNIELSLIGQNLFDREHPEYSPNSEVPRGFYGKIQWQW